MLSTTLSGSMEEPINGMGAVPLADILKTKKERVIFGIALLQQLGIIFHLYRDIVMHVPHYIGNPGDELFCVIPVIVCL